ncbi:dihydrofolate reductase family protein [Pseudonocardia sp. C8]|uniref:dihydrofolate reductase family protein n=1 Tax=Pseudonocardia sp. C8 TaxID=2762759 RepID=UPI001642D33B|nr:dihydrofolate reductase family protein [Pseudonocardia sp. C8]MBC3194465.1 dihydrofolate reductase family protein [Pseudonocardia sp. C8]
MTGIQQIFPTAGAGPLSVEALERLYAYPAGAPYVAVNFVSSADGAVEVDGLAAGLSTPPDRVVLDLGTDLADVVLVGAGTATVEGFTGVKPDERMADRRHRFGLEPVPATAVVTSTGRSLGPSAPVLTDTLVPTIVFTCAAAPERLRASWAAAGAHVVLVGDRSVDLAAVVAELGRRGLHRINCMGGPALFGSLAEAGLVDELRLTVAPFLVSGDAARIARGAGMDPERLELVSVVTGDDTLLVRYRVGTSPGR